MNIAHYLERIHFTDPFIADSPALIKLHEQHVFHVPFENLDVYYKRAFDMKPDHVYDKVVNQRRGGFCYELNLLFHLLLNGIGFNSKIISSRIIDENGNLGPRYDHLSLCIKTDKEYLADVGYGDLFVRPIEIRTGIQSDGRNYFKIEEYNDTDFVLSMSADGESFQDKYTFNLSEVSADKFNLSCLDKQVNPNSYFVKNTICTLPTATGRVTLFNNKFMEKRNGDKIEVPVINDLHMKVLLLDKFGITLK